MLKFSHFLYLPLYHMDSPTYKGHNDLTWSSPSSYIS